MTTIQRINSVGTSKAVVIPKDFFTYWEKKGKTFQEIRMMISEDMEKIVIMPIFKDKENEK